MAKTKTKLRMTKRKREKKKLSSLVHLLAHTLRRSVVHAEVRPATSNRRNTNAAREGKPLARSNRANKRTRKETKRNKARRRKRV
jgi:hypothetical protein